MSSATLAHPAVGDDMDYESLIGGLTAGGIVALLGAAFPYVREWYVNRAKSDEEQTKRVAAKTAVDAKNVDVSAIVAQQMQHFTDQMMARITSLENNERALRAEMQHQETIRDSQIEELENENEQCRESNMNLTARVDTLTRQVTALSNENASLKRELVVVRSENKRLREQAAKQLEEIRRLQRSLAFTPLEVPHDKTIPAPHPSLLIEEPFKKDRHHDE